MKSCLTIFFSIILLISIWWGYSSYQAHVDCEDCKKNLNKYYLHLRRNPWNSSNCYILDCFCNTKLVLRKVNSFRKILVAKDKVAITFLEKDIYEIGEYKTVYSGSADDIDWENVYKNIFKRRAQVQF